MRGGHSIYRGEKFKMQENTNAAVKTKPSPTAGLVSGDQRVNITASGSFALATTGGYLVNELIRLPCYEILPLIEPISSIGEEMYDLEDDLARGYRAMAIDNNLLAEKGLPVAMETWPDWEP